jgi:hypothetical protein
VVALPDEQETQDFKRLGYHCSSVLDADAPVCLVFYKNQKWYQAVKQNCKYLLRIHKDAMNL